MRDRLPVALSAVALLGAGAARAWVVELDTVASALVGAGLICLGVFLAMEARR